MTQAAEGVELLIADAFPLTGFGRFNCRPIGGLPWIPTSNPSQHSFDSLDLQNGYGNARDLWAPEGYSVKARYDYLDEIFDWLKERNAPWYLSDTGGSWNAPTVDGGLGIKRIIWRQPAHHNHIHFDMWPTGIGHPRCSPYGPDREYYKYSTGEIIQTNDPLPEGNVEADMSYKQFRSDEFDQWSDQNVREAYAAGMFEARTRSGSWNYWTFEGYAGDGSGTRGSRTPDEKQRFMTDYYAHLGVKIDESNLPVPQ